MEELFSFSSPKLLSFLLILLVFIIWKKKKSHINSNKPPQPPKLPLIGNLHQIISLLPHRRLAELAKIYGPLMQLQLGQDSAVVVSSPEVAKELFKDHDINVSHRCRVSGTDILFYNYQDIAFAPYGEYWRQMRKICTLELFSSRRVQSFRSIREEEAMSVFTVVDMFPSLEFIHVITGMKSRLLKMHRELDQIVENIIQEHKTEQKEQGLSEANNLLNVLLQLQADPDSLLTTDGIKAITLEILIGATDTSTTVLEWAMSELMKNPKTMKKKLPNQMKPEDLDMSETFALTIRRKNPLYLIPVAPQP
ncbi:cytochrome P450 family 71 subfamily A polypeptide 25 [Euphorbia peplus]|nr:cytochrome P450 family 71 subfamily A polypeptide 25 [Euphorbia peplus]